MFETYRKAVAVVVVGVASIAAQFVPGFPDLSPEAIGAISTAITLAAVWLIPNRVRGVNVDEIARAILEAQDDRDLAVYVSRPDFEGPSRLVRIAPDPSRGHRAARRPRVTVSDLPPKVGE